MTEPDPGHHLFKGKSYFFVKSLEGGMEAEAEAVDGRLKEAEAEVKEKSTAVASLHITIGLTKKFKFKGMLA